MAQYLKIFGFCVQYFDVVTFCPQTQVHKQCGRVVQGVVTEAVGVLQLIYKPANQIVCYHDRLLASSNERKKGKKTL